MRAPVDRTRWAAAAAYTVLLAFVMLEKVGQTTTDTKASLVVAPWDLIRSTFSLWNPQTSLGELQNQAYGFLFPMGPFFAGLHALGTPAWVAERLWSWLIIVVACEGARRVARELGLNPWPALGAGLAFGLNVRILTEVGVRSAEVLPTAVLPWMLLPVLWVLRGRIDHRQGAIWSAAAFLFFGAVNGTATIAPLPLVAVFIIWGCRRGLARWSFLAWWSGLVILASLWWASSLIQLSSYSPPFFDYVEDARTTTSVTGFDASLRGASNWVGYLTTAGVPSWPSAWSLDYQPVLVAATGLIGVLGLVGLVCWRSRWRTPLVISALIGLTCLTIGHTSQTWLASPLAGSVQDLLDGPFALLRNIAKIDPVLRLPLALGFGVALSRLGELVSRYADQRALRRAGSLRAAVVAACLLVAVGAQPLLALDLRTPGWTAVPSYWSQAANFLAAQPGQNGAWVVPGSGFGVQTWGWTMDEPMSVVGRSPWVTRSQAPLVPVETIRLLSTLEDTIAGGTGSPDLGQMLTRIGLGFVVLRRDLDPALEDGLAPNVVASALAQSGGLHRVATFGQSDLGPQVEIYEVNGRDRTDRSDLRMLDAGSAVTVSSGPSDVLTAAGAGLLDEDRAGVVEGDDGWERPVQLIGDGYQLRERQFGRVHANEGPVLAGGEPPRAFRKVEDYPGSPGARPVVADYHSVGYIDASSSQAYPDSLGPIHSENAPYAAVDGDLGTGWTTAFGTHPVGQWLEVHYRRKQGFGQIIIRSDAPTRGGVRRWQVTGGGRTVWAVVDPATGIATAQLGGVIGRTLRVTAAAVVGADRAESIGIREISGPGLPVERSLVVPPVQAPKSLVAPTYLFAARAETRACVLTLLGPDCDPDRYRPAEESTGIDREFAVTRAADWSLDGTVVARTDPSVDKLLAPFLSAVIIGGSSTYYNDPGVSPRMAYDGTTTTSWIADPHDSTPTLSLDFAKPTEIDRIAIAVPAGPGVAATSATLVAGSQTRQVALGGLGTFDPLLAVRHLEIRFANPTRDGAPIGISELTLSHFADKSGHSLSTVPFNGEAKTGLPCGFGPNVTLDGHRYLTKVGGTMGAVLGAGPLALSLCDGPIAIGPGKHRIRIASSVEFQPTQVVLTPVSAATEAAPRRSLNVISQSDTSQRVRVGPGAAGLLVTTRNHNKGWVATLDGRELAPQRVDGWAQGWRVPAGAGGTIEVQYKPQHAYLTGLITGLVLAADLLLFALWLLLRNRPKPVETGPAMDARRVGRRGRLRAAALSVTAVGGAAVFGGLPGLIGAAIARVLGRRRSLRIVLGAALATAGPLVTAVAFARTGPGSVPDVADVLSGIGAVMLLVGALVDHRDGDVRS